MTNPVPAKVFRDMSILCLGAEFVSKKVSAAPIGFGIDIDVFWYVELGRHS